MLVSRPLNDFTATYRKLLNWVYIQYPEYTFNIKSTIFKVKTFQHSYILCYIKALNATKYIIYRNRWSV